MGKMRGDGRREKRKGKSFNTEGTEAQRAQREGGKMGDGRREKRKDKCKMDSRLRGNDGVGSMLRGNDGDVSARE